jgi:hypothetical protein
MTYVGKEKKTYLKQKEVGPCNFTGNEPIIISNKTAMKIFLYLDKI